MVTLFIPWDYLMRCWWRELQTSQIKDYISKYGPGQIWAGPGEAIHAHLNCTWKTSGNLKNSLVRALAKSTLSLKSGFLQEMYLFNIFIFSQVSYIILYPRSNPYWTKYSCIEGRKCLGKCRLSPCFDSSYNLNYLPFSNDVILTHLVSTQPHCLKWFSK